MKHKFSIIVLASSFLFGCKGEIVDVSGLVAERDSIKNVNLKQQQELDNLNEFVSIVSNGLDSIAMQEKLLNNNGPEGTILSREQIKDNLTELAAMLARQRERMSALEDSLKLKGNGSEGLHNIISHLNDQLIAKEKVINQLRAEVNNKNSDIARLQSRISTLSENVEVLDKKTKVQQEALVTQSDMMNECYMKIGTKKQLKQAGILDGKRLNSSALTPDKFVRVDIRQLRELPINAKKPKVLTTMPGNSYYINRNEDGTSTLVINDPTAFWSVYNYLVIETD